jgi:hypothetical protein
MSLASRDNQYDWMVEETPKTVAVPRRNGRDMRPREVTRALSAIPTEWSSDAGGAVGRMETFVTRRLPFVTER